MSKLKTIFIIVLMLSLVIACIGCICRIKLNQADTEEHQIRQVLSNFTEAYETRNINLLKESLWEKSSFYSQIVNNANSDFAQDSTISIEFSEINITFYSEGNRALVTLKKRFRATNEIGQEVKYIEDTGIIEMIKSESNWTIVSMHWRAPMRNIPQEEKRRMGL